MEVRVVGLEERDLLDEMLSSATTHLGAHRGGAGLLEDVLGDRGPSGALSALEDALGSTLGIIWVLGEANGFAIASRGQNAAWFTVWVDPDARRQGGGSVLVETALSWLSDHDAEVIDSIALPGDRHMKNLLEQAGFKARLLTLRREG